MHIHYTAPVQTLNLDMLARHVCIGHQKVRQGGMGGWGGGVEGFTSRGRHGCQARWQALGVVVQFVPEEVHACASTRGDSLPVILELHHAASGEQASKPAVTHTVSMLHHSKLR